MALSFERVEPFFREFQAQHDAFFQSIQGIERGDDRRWYTSVILNRLIPLYFLQRRGWLDGGDRDYLENKLGQSQLRGENRFFNEFLQTLFFEGLTQSELDRNPTARVLVGQIPHLDNCLFRYHSLERKYPDIAIGDRAFEQLFEWFGTYEWRLHDRSSSSHPNSHLEITPELWGYAFEQYLNRDTLGGYVTPPEISEYLCERTVGRAIVDGANERCDRTFEDFHELMVRLDPALCLELVRQVLPSLSILDPACGSGTLLLAAMKMLLSVYVAAIEIVSNQGDKAQKQWLSGWLSQWSRFSLPYALERRIATENLYGVDIREEAIEIGQLRLYLELIAASDRVSELEYLPNLDFNLTVGNSLIGWIRVDEEGFDAVGEHQQGNLLQPLVADSYRQILREKNIRIEQYKAQSLILQEAQDIPKGTNPQFVRDRIADVDRKAQRKLDRLLLDEFSLRLGIHYPQSQVSGKRKKRLPILADIEALKPFHWGYQFNKTIEERGGFDVIITHPPWEKFQPHLKDFIADRRAAFERCGLLNADSQLDLDKFSQSRELFSQWQDIQNHYAFASAYYRSTDRYQHQTVILNDRKLKNNLYLYNLFLELCWQVLRSGGYCAVEIPSRFYRELESTSLREILVNRTQLDSLIYFDRSLDFLRSLPEGESLSLLNFQKDSSSQKIKILDKVECWQDFGSCQKISGNTIDISKNRLAVANNFYILSWKSGIEMGIMQKITQFPSLSKELENCWNFTWGKESRQKERKKSLKNTIREDQLRLYDLKAIKQSPDFIEPIEFSRSIKYSSDSTIENVFDRKRTFHPLGYRLALKANTRKSDPRTTIATFLAKDTRGDKSLWIARPNSLTFPTLAEQLAILAILNSFVFDFYVRTIIVDRVNLFYISQLRIPRIRASNRYFQDLVERSAKLVCTRPEFDELAREVGLGSHECGVTEKADRAKLRLELDALTAHFYGLTAAEFQFVLSVFPKVSEFVKVRAIEAYREVIYV
ncbi:MAG: DNA methyltransferase [Cyanobacteriota bacterium]|nr:DNA methyltransferase [Cyanobacteriota bacterium]